MPESFFDELDRQLNPASVSEGAPSLATSLHLGLQSNPDQEAKVRRSAARAGMPPELVRQNAEAARVADVQGLVTDLGGYPLTQTLLADPNNAAIAHDATESLIEIEKEGGFFSRIGKSILEFGEDVGETVTNIGKTIGGVGETIGDAFEKGELTHRLGYEGYALKGATGPERATIDRRVQELKTQMEGLGVSNDGFLGFLTSAAEIVGQQFGTFSQPAAAQRIGLGGTLGAGAGLAGGLFAPVTVPAGAAAGLVTGTISHLATDAFVVESGHAYIDMIEGGIDTETAEVLATGVGTINAGLEILGTAAVAVPITKAAKAIAKRAMGQAIKRASVVSAAKNFAVGYGTAVGGETATEIMQEGVLMAAEEVARHWTDSEQEIKPVTLEEAINRMEDVAVKTFKGMAVLALPGSSVNYIADRGKAKKAIERDQAIEKIAAAVDQSPVSARLPEVISKHVTDALEVKSVGMPVEFFDAMLGELGYTPAEVLTNENLLRLHEEALQIGGDVSIPAGALVQNMMIGPNKVVFDKYREHIRWNSGDMTAAEAVEFQSSGLEAELATNVKVAIETIDADQANLEQRLAAVETTETVAAAGTTETVAAAETTETVVAAETTETVAAAGTTETVAAEVSGDTLLPGRVEAGLNPELQAAEDSLGLQALFRTADEAGMTEKQYTAYLAKVQRSATESNRRKEVSQSKREARQVTKEIKSERAEVVKEVAAVVREEPVYVAIHGTEEMVLDRASISDALGGGSLTANVVKRLKKQGVRISSQRETGMHVDEYADLYEFENGNVMLDAMVAAKPEKQEVAERAEREVRVRNPELFSRQAEIQENLTALMHDDTQQVLAAEIDTLTDDRRAGKIKPALVREVARRALAQHTIRDISVSKYLANARKHGREAGKALRAGDRDAARQAKVNQLLNMEFAKEAEAKRQIVQKGHNYLSQFTKSNRKWNSLGPGYIDAIRDFIGQFSLSPDLSASRRTKLQDFVTKAQSDGANFEFPKRLLDDQKQNYKDFTIHDFEVVIQKIKEIHKAGIEDQKNRDQAKRTKTAIRVDAILEALERKVPVEQTLETRGRKKAIARSFEEGKLLLLNADSILRDLDNFENLGPVYNAVKGPIDLSVTNGYGSETNIGLINREKQIAEKLLELYGVFSKEEMNTLSRANIMVPGFSAPISRNAQLSLLLNIGNEQNRQALYDSGQVTEEQLDNLIEHASKRDMEFVQSVWNYLDSFWAEITEGTQRRRGFAPEKVQSTAIKTDHGNYEGGYYPLRYDNDKGVNDPTTESVEEAIAQARYGRAIASHTRHDHTEQRVGSQGRPVLLDLFVANSHLDQVAYDLELGDAINETYHVMHDTRTKKAFRDAGQVNTWKALDLWLGDVVTGEMHSGGVVEKSLRWLRAGFTISKLGWNFVVALIQPLGIIQTSVHLGHKNTLQGLKHMLSMPLYGKDNVFQFVNEQSQVMAQREETFHKDIADASQLVSDSWIRRALPEGTAEFVNNSFFYSIKKTQRFVDTWTWIAAKEAGLTEFNNDEDLAIQFADRTVIRSQASGNFQERTPFERGSISTKTRQTELIRTFTALISYFMAKTNVTFERTKKTNFRNPGQVVSWASDMVLLYVVEAALVGLIRGQWPDEEEEDDYGKAVAKYLAGETLNTMIAGVPGIREFASEASGYRGGGVFSSVIGDFGKLTEQITQGEIDQALLTSANNLGGVLFKYPASQISKTGRAISYAQEGEDVEWIEFLMGPKWNKYR